MARRAGLLMRRFATGPEFNLYCVRSKRLPREGTIYISAGIHGDEPAGTEALITWAEENTRLLRRRPFFLVPCINPWGLVNNVPHRLEEARFEPDFPERRCRGNRGAEAGDGPAAVLPGA